MALIAPFARLARSTNRSTPFTAITGYQLQNVTVAGRAAHAAPVGKAARVSATSLTAKPLDLDYKHEIISRVTRNVTASAVRAEMQGAQRHRDVITLVAAALVLHRIHDHDRVH